MDKGYLSKVHSVPQRNTGSKERVVNGGAGNGRRIEAARRLPEWMGFDSVDVEGFPKGRENRLKIVFGSRSSDPKPYFNCGKGHRLRWGEQFCTVYEQWGNGNEDGVNYANFAMILGKEAQRGKSGSEFRKVLPAFLENGLGELIEEGVPIRAFFDGIVHRTERRKMRGLLGNNPYTYLWQVPKTNQRNELGGLTDTEAKKGFEMIAIADALAYHAHDSLRVDLEGRGRIPMTRKQTREKIAEATQGRIAMGKGLVNLIRNPGNLGILYEGKFIKPEELPINSFDDGSTMVPENLLAMCREIAA